MTKPLTETEILTIADVEEIEKRVGNHQVVMSVESFAAMLADMTRLTNEVRRLKGLSE